MRKGKKPKQPLVGGKQVRRYPTTQDIGICGGCGWRCTVTIRRYSRTQPVGAMTAHMSPIQIGCPVCARNRKDVA